MGIQIALNQSVLPTNEVEAVVGTFEGNNNNRNGKTIGIAGSSLQKLKAVHLHDQYLGSSLAGSENAEMSWALVRV